MHCESCLAIGTGAAKRVDDEEAVEGVLGLKTVTVRFRDSNEAQNRIRTASEEAGFPVGQETVWCLSAVGAIV